MTESGLLFADRSSASVWWNLAGDAGLTLLTTALFALCIWGLVRRLVRFQTQALQALESALRQHAEALGQLARTLERVGRPVEGTWPVGEISLAANSTSASDTEKP